MDANILFQRTRPAASGDGGRYSRVYSYGAPTASADAYYAYASEGYGAADVTGSCCDPLSPKALRASMGAVFRLKIAQEPSPQGLAERLAQAGFSTWAAVPDRQARRVTEMDFSQGRHSLFIGNEGSGLTPETAGLCKGKLTIPMLGRAESLNAAAAATVLLWELARGGDR